MDRRPISVQHSQTPPNLLSGGSTGSHLKLRFSSCAAGVCLDSLHARGHQIDRSAAARALSYFSARASGAEYNEQAWRAAVEFMIEQGLCFEWAINGNVGSMIEMSASHFQGKAFDRFSG